MMKRIILTGILVVFMAVPAMAVPTVVIGDSHGSGPGGEFLVTPSGFPFTPTSLGESFGKFETFCIEKDEYISFGPTYNVDFSTVSIEGGIGGGSPDPLDIKTAYLYDQFITGSSTIYDYANTGVGRVASADALQDVIWYIEDE